MTRGELKNWIIAKNEEELNAVNMDYYTPYSISEKMGGVLFKIREHRRK